MNLNYIRLKCKEWFVKNKIKRNLLILVPIIAAMKFGMNNQHVSITILYCTYVIEWTMLMIFGDMIKFTKQDRIDLIKSIKHKDDNVNFCVDLIVKSIRCPEIDELGWEKTDPINIGVFNLYLYMDLNQPRIRSREVINLDKHVVEKYNTMFKAENNITRGLDRPQKEWEIENAFREILNQVNFDQESGSVFIYPKYDKYVYLREYLFKFMEYNPIHGLTELQRIAFELKG